MKPSRQTLTFDGLTDAEVNLSEQYERTQITIVGLTEGVITVTAQESGSTKYNEIVNNTIDLECQDTIVLNGAIIKSLKLSPFPRDAFTVKVIQTKPIGNY